MGRFIRLSFPAEGVAAVAELLEQAAPRTSEAVWRALPVAGMAHHAVYSGSEGVLLLPDVLRVDPENATSDVATGDVAFTWFAAGSAYGVDADFAEICWFYAEDARPSMHGGAAPVSVFARIAGDAAGFYAVCRRMRREGIKPLAVERWHADHAAAAQAVHTVVCRDARFCSAGPSVARSGSELVVAFVQHTPHLGGGHADPRGLPALVRSSDEGRAWSPEPEPLGGYRYWGAERIELVGAEDGALSAAIWLPVYAAGGAQPGRRTSDGRIVHLRSTDGGRSWVEAPEAGPARGALQLPGGRTWAAHVAQAAIPAVIGRTSHPDAGGVEAAVREFGLADMGSPSAALLGDGRVLCVYDGVDGGPGWTAGAGVRGIHGTLVTPTA
jgi:hypothetical protein